MNLARIGQAATDTAIQLVLEQEATTTSAPPCAWA